MGKIMVIGPVGAGKTSLLQALRREAGRAVKTQSLSFFDSAIDTPGEYSQLPRFYPALLVTAMEAAAVLIIQDATARQMSLPPGFAGMFARPVIGAATKIDLPDADPARAKTCLAWAGVREPIFLVSAHTGEGLILLRDYLRERGYHYE
ncbi:EutP/PduV family microcompartment system protein [Acetonema longum]|uniref:Ethanolamine utilization protein EutP n=1 Tax=Acetonema longum DSM 6540 TaxID=1009370 RepID=F7NH27_9FIRM|nr:EutP/PduV family microcompartment system protein [Acetonema longum]EGO64758.1 ethanolamine utilization protein EutP [Acetonema longum DSM 6540]